MIDIWPLFPLISPIFSSFMLGKNCFLAKEMAGTIKNIFDMGRFRFFASTVRLAKVRVPAMWGRRSLLKNKDNYFWPHWMDSSPT